MDVMDYDNGDHDHDHAMDHDHDDHHDMQEQKAVKQDPWAGYYDFIINEGSFKFWAVFQVSSWRSLDFFQLSTRLDTHLLLASKSCNNS